MTPVTGEGVVMFSSPLAEDQLVVLFRDLPHRHPDMARPHRLVRNKRELRDERLELNWLLEYLDRLQLHPIGEDLIPHPLRRHKERRCILISFRYDLERTGDGRGEDRIAFTFCRLFLLLGDINEDGVAGLHPFDDRFVPLRDTPDILLPDDLPVVAVGGCEPVFHKGEFEGEGDKGCRIVIVLTNSRFTIIQSPSTL